MKREKALKETLRKLNKNNIFSGSEYSEIARLYGTPNIHKSFSSGSIPPVRPIVSSVDTYNYKPVSCIINQYHPVSWFFTFTTYSLKLYNQKQFYFHRRNQTARHTW